VEKEEEEEEEAGGGEALRAELRATTMIPRKC
jgi:hypothetical protein